MPNLKKKIEYFTFSIMLFSILLTPSPTNAVAPKCVAGANEYCMLAPLTDNAEKIQISEGQFVLYLQRLINLSIGFAGALAVIMLIVGGLEYILSSVNEATKNDAKNRITNAVLGLIIILSIYLILNTINPDLIKLGLPALPKPTAPAEPPATPPPPIITPEPDIDLGPLPPTIPPPSPSDISPPSIAPPIISIQTSPTSATNIAGVSGGAPLPPVEGVY